MWSSDASCDGSHRLQALHLGSREADYSRALRRRRPEEAEVSLSRRSRSVFPFLVRPDAGAEARSHGLRLRQGAEGDTGAVRGRDGGNEDLYEEAAGEVCSPTTKGEATIQLKLTSALGTGSLTSSALARLFHA